MLPQIRVVTLENPYKNIKDPLVKHLFAEMLCVKEEGYGPEYPDSFLPVDSSDYVGTHHLFCVEENKKLMPIAGFRHALLHSCDYYHVKIPLLALVEDAGAEPHGEILRQLFKEHRKEGRHLISSGGFTIRKHLRGHKELTGIIRELVVGLMHFDHLYYRRATLIGGGVIRFKTEKLWEKTGYLPISKDGILLPPVHVATGGGEPVMIMVMDKSSTWARECYEKHHDVIEKRLIISSEVKRYDRKAA